MVVEDYELIDDLINEDLLKGNIKELIKLRNFLNKQLFSINTSIKNHKEYNPTEDNILNLSLVKFLQDNVKGNSSFKRGVLIIQFARINGISNIRDVRVSDTLGISKEELLSYKNGAGKYTVQKYDELLQLYGYSLSKDEKAKKQMK